MLVVLGVLYLGGYSSNKNNSNKVALTPTAAVLSDTFTYNGFEGKDALTLLKEKAKVVESQPGFVVEINGRSASSLKKEYWAFYINGKMSDVGAGDYMTKDGDKLEWKITNY